MRVLIISDIHANADALNAVLQAAGRVDAVWGLGDLVGYGPVPNECITILRALPNLFCLLGNHDAAAIGQLALHGFNGDARTSIEWLRDCLTPESLAFLRSLQPRREAGGGTPGPARPPPPPPRYFMGFFFRPKTTQVSTQAPPPNTKAPLRRRCIANPVSVGQPRDRDPRAAFAIFEDKDRTWDYVRVPYDIAAVQERMRRAKLPERHI